MTTIYILRHGHKEFQSDNPPLSDIGREQVERVLDFFKDMPLQVIYASPTKRAYETAYAVAQKFSLPLITDKNLIERMEWGTIPGQSFEEFVEIWKKTVEDRDYKPQAGDSADETGIRMRKVLDNAVEKYRDQDILLVSHGGAIADLLYNLFSREYLASFDESLSQGLSKEVRECSITTLIFDKGKYHMKEFASVEHLKGVDSHYGITD